MPASSPGWSTWRCRATTPTRWRARCAVSNPPGCASSSRAATRVEAPSGLRGIELELVGEDRLGIVSNLTRILAESGISIEQLHTEIVGGKAAGKTFKVVAHLLVPNALSADELRRRLEALAKEMMVDIALGDRPVTAAA